MKLLSDFKKEDIELNRKIKFKNSKVTFDGIPLIMPSDDMFATLEVSMTLPGVMTFISDDYEVEDLHNFYFTNKPNSIYKLTKGQITKFMTIMSNLPKGYLQHVFIEGSSFNDDLDIINKIRKKHKSVTIWYDTKNESPILDDHLTLNGVDAIKTKIPKIVKIRECFTWGSINSDFIEIKIEEGFPEFKGETNKDLQRIYGNKSLPLSEKTLQEHYNNFVEEIRNILYDNGCRTIKLYEYA